jgi:molybdate transport system substrate-binding protein
MRRLLAVAAAALLLTSVAACGSDSPTGKGSSSSSPQKLTVFAAASLTSTFTELGKQFEASHKGVSVAFNFAGSSDLVAQINQGAPADVFASADTANMDKAVAAKSVEGQPESFASNVLEIAVPPDNPAHVTSLQDLAKPGTKVVTCAAEVPCGDAAKKVEEQSGVTIKPVSEEQSVTDVLGKVENGEADAGLVYVTDVKTAGDKVKGITFPESSKVVNVYPIATLAGSQNKALAKEFVQLVNSRAGQSVLAKAGFSKP